VGTVFLDELLEVCVVVEGSVGLRDVVAVLSDDLSGYISALAHTECEEKEINCIGCHTNNTEILQDEVENVSEVARDHQRSNRKHCLDPGDELSVDEGEQKHQRVERDPVKAIGLVQGVVRPEVLANQTKSCTPL